MSQPDQVDDRCEHGRCQRPWIMQIERRDGTVIRMCAPHGDLLRSKIAVTEKPIVTSRLMLGTTGTRQHVGQRGDQVG